jgi:hypothetical protein
VAVKARHHLSNEEWAALGESDRLVELVEACKLRRIRTGATKRERAQKEIVDAVVQPARPEACPLGGRHG